MFSPEDIEEIAIAEYRIRLTQGNPKIDLYDADDLFEYLKHGDNKHQRWLKHAIYAWAVGDERPRLEL